MDKKVQYNLWYALAAVLGILLLQTIWQQYQQVEPIPYSQFQTYLKDGKIDDIVITDQYIRGTIKGAKSGEPSEFVTTRVEPSVAAELEKYGVKYRGATESGMAHCCAIFCPGSCRSSCSSGCGCSCSARSRRSRGSAAAS
jgi:cell division protease FtsH